MIFVDSGAWFSLLVKDDPDHQNARAWFDNNNDRLILTDYILDETLTLLRARKQHKHAIELGEAILNQDRADLVFLNLEDIEAAWEVFRQYSDKLWSFTDCTSKVVMERLGLTTAFAFDQHFRQFGNIYVVP